MKKNLYYRSSYARVNSIKAFVLLMCIAISSYPRLLLEVFIRRNFGERYFSLGSCICLTLLLIAIPYGLQSFMVMLMSNYSGRFAPPSIWDHNITWFLFTAAFLFVSIQRRSEIKRSNSVFDFKKISQFDGDRNAKLQTLGNRKWTPRQYETLIEPLPFFVLGIILKLLGENLGSLLVFCSIVYSLSYVGAYYLGDHFVMNQIDEMIINEDLKETFVTGQDSDRGVRFRGRRPNDEAARRRVAERFTESENAVVDVLQTA